MAVVRNLMVRAGADFSELQKEMKKAQTFMKSAGKELTNVGKSLTLGLTMPIIGIGAAGIQTASDLKEVQNVVDTAFKSSSKMVDEWAKTTLNSFGLTELQSKKFAGSMRAMLGSMSLAPEVADDMSLKLVGLAGDMASFYNLDHDTAWQKIRSGIAGETEPLKELGINMSVANLEAYAMSKGINTAWKEMSAAEQATLRYNYLMETTKDVQGDFSKTSGSFSNQLRVVKGELSSIAGELAQGFLPILEKGLTKLREATSWFRSLTQEQKEMVAKIALLVASIGPFLLVLGKIMTIGAGLMGWFRGVTVAISALSAGTGTLGAVFTAVLGPAGIVLAVVAGIAAVGFAIKKLWNTNEEFRNACLDCWTNIKEFGVALFTALQAFWAEWGDTITAWFQGVWNMIAIIFTTFAKLLSNAFKGLTALLNGDWETAWECVKNVFRIVWDFICSLFNNMVQTMLNIWDTMKEGVMSKVYAIRDSIISGISSAIDWIRGLPGQAWEWGSNMINGFIDGIKSKINKVKDAVSGVMSSVKDFLGFNSPSKKGDGRFITKWGTNMISGFMDGIDLAIPDLKGIMDNVITLPDIEQYNTVTNTSEDNKSIDKNLEIPVIVEGREVARAIAPFKQIFEDWEVGRC